MRTGGNMRVSPNLISCELKWRMSERWKEGGREEMKGENRRGPKLLIDFEGEEKMEESKGMTEACE